MSEDDFHNSNIFAPYTTEIYIHGNVWRMYKSEEKPCYPH